MGGILKLDQILDGQRRGVLFVCSRNDSLSQMAEGFARFLCPKDMSVFSAGVAPTSMLEMTIRTMKEVGIDVSSQRSKGIDAIPLDHIAIAISLVDEERRPDLPERIQVLDWPIDDPLETDEDLATFRASRDKVREMVSALF